MTLNCMCCGKKIRPKSQNPNQKYCSNLACQNDRKRTHKSEKRKDPAFREQEREYQQKWRERNPGYMREYRKKNPDYEAENRARQRERNQQKRGTKKPEDQEEIVKGDAWKALEQNGFTENWWSGNGGAEIVKGDASTPLMPVVLLPVAMIEKIVKATRQRQKNSKTRCLHE